MTYITKSLNVVSKNEAIFLKNFFNDETSFIINEYYVKEDVRLRRAETTFHCNFEDIIPVPSKHLAIRMLADKLHVYAFIGRWFTPEIISYAIGRYMQERLDEKSYGDYDEAENALLNRLIEIARTEINHELIIKRKDGIELGSATSWKITNENGTITNFTLTNFKPIDNDYANTPGEIPFNIIPEHFLKRMELNFQYDDYTYIAYIENITQNDDENTYHIKLKIINE